MRILHKILCRRMRKWTPFFFFSFFFFLGGRRCFGLRRCFKLGEGATVEQRSELTTHTLHYKCASIIPFPFRLSNPPPPPSPPFSPVQRREINISTNDAYCITDPWLLPFVVVDYWPALCCQRSLSLCVSLHRKKLPICFILLQRGEKKAILVQRFIFSFISKIILPLTR